MRTARILRATRQQLELRQRPAGHETVFLGLGGNVGDRLHYLNRAVALLHSHHRISVEDISSVYETEPVRLPDGSPPTGVPGEIGGEAVPDGAFYNVAVRLLTDLAPLPLLRACQKVELTLGRVRGVRWGPRTIDIDILLFGDRQLDAEELTIPHAELTARAFAMVPLLEVAPGWQLPDGRSLGQVVATLAPIDGIAAVGRQVSLTPLPSGPPQTSSARS